MLSALLLFVAFRVVCQAMIYLWVWRFGPWLGSLLFVSPKEMRNKRKAKRLANNLLAMEDVLWFMFMVHVYVVGFVVDFSWNPFESVSL